MTRVIDDVLMLSASFFHIFFLSHPIKTHAGHAKSLGCSMIYGDFIFSFYFFDF
jgi:hypothetical protein